MTTKINKNNYKQRVYNYLINNKFKDGYDTKPTHVSYGLFQGKFVLDDKSRGEFIQIYCDAIESGVNDLSILETHKEYGPILIDIDLNKPYSTECKDIKRLYNRSLILSIIYKYNQSIETYLDISNIKDYNIVLLEKQHCNIKSDLIKDGFHIIYPNICTTAKIRHLIRLKVVESCKLDDLFKDYLHGPETIIDEAVVSRNSWFLYGSKKPESEFAYNVTAIFNDKMELCDIENMNKTEIIKGLSIQSRRFQEKKATPLITGCGESDIDAECNKNGLVQKPLNNINNIDNDEKIKNIIKYVNILNDKRASNYNDWLNLGLALHTTNIGLLSIWIEFSKRDKKKFKEGECEKLWRNLKTPNNSAVLTFRSIKYWAKQDNPKEYIKIKDEELKESLIKSYDGSTFNIATTLYTKYNDFFVCASINGNIWYQFNTNLHKWEKIEAGYTLSKLLSQDFADEYNKEISEITKKIIGKNDTEREVLENKRACVIKICDKLKNITFKKQIMEEARAIFYDKQFLEKLDSNELLIGFENGVYDIGEGVKRDGRPDDYITLSTKNEYHKWNPSNPYNKDILKFLEQILPNERVRNYFLITLSTCIAGQTKEEKLHILNGSGSNGKSLLMDLMSCCLGEYYMSCPISVLTKKRGNSNETSPEKVRMKGRRCGVFQETDDGEKINVGVMKEMTGGDKILVRDLYKGSEDMLEFKPQMKYFITCNQLPEVPSTDEGTWRRLRVIEFASKFTGNPIKPNEYKIDTTLKEKIKLWGPTFISYLIHIYNTEYKPLNNKPLIEPTEIMGYTEQYKMENDYYNDYIRTCLTITDNTDDILKSQELYDNFKIWYRENHPAIQKSTPNKIDALKELNKHIGELRNGQNYIKLKFKNDSIENVSVLD